MEFETPTCPSSPLRRWALHLIAACASLGCLAGCASAPSAPARPQSYAFWPQFPAEPRIQFLRSFGGSTDVAPAKDDLLERLVLGSNQPDAESIQKPYGVAMKDGKIYVCDIRHQSLTVLDLVRRQTRLVGVSGLNQLSHPVDVAVADDGMLYVADSERGAIVVFDAKERFSRAYGREKMKPVAVAVHGDRLYVCNMNSHAVEIMDRLNGKVLGVIGKVGDEDGDFRVPLGVDTDREGNVYVVDMMRCRVQKFSPDGKLLSAMGSLGDYAGSFARPKQIAVDPEGIVYVVDASFQNVQMFDDQNRLLMSFGAAGGFPGSMNLPVGVCVSDERLDLFQDQLHPGFEARRLVVVTNQFGPDKVAVYALGSRRPSYALQDMAATAAPVSAGVGMGTNAGERTRLQNVGIEEPPPAEGEGAPEPPADQPPAAPPRGPSSSGEGRE